MGLNLRRRVSEVLNSPVLSYFGVRGFPDKVQPGDVDGNGNIIVTPRDAGNNPINGTTPDMDGQGPSPVDVTPVDNIIIVANPNRRALVITNISDTPINVSPDSAGAPNAAPQVNAGGGVYTLSMYGPVFSRGPIHASHSGVGAKVATYQEFH